VAERLPNKDAFDKAIQYIGECQSFHAGFIADVDRRYKAYRGVVDELREAAEWTSKLYPPYIMHIVETSLASLVDDRLSYRIRPRATMEQYFDPSAGERARLGSEAHQVLFDWQVRRSGFHEEQRPFALQNAIAGITVAKTLWTTREERRRQLVSEEQPLTDANGFPVVDPMTGQPVTVPSMREVVKPVVVYDGPVTEVRDIHDFMWHEAATKIDNARYLVDRVWLSPEDLWEQFEGDDPMWGPKRGGWPERLVREIVGTADAADNYPNRWGADSRKTTKDLIEVCEVWDQVNKTVTTVVNRSALLAYREKFPFFHESPPFVVCSTQPDLFGVVGISQVEKIDALQKMLWDVANQRLDNLRLINNAIIFFRPDMENPEDLEFEPGALWPMEDPTQVGQWAPNPIPAEISLGSEALLKGDMQNLSGGFPFSSGTDSQVVDQKTATGASIVTNIAQRSIDMSKASMLRAWEKVGQQRIILNQQFIRTPTAAPVLGLDGEEEIAIVMPEILQGDFNFEIEALPDAARKQEEQASAQALYQIGMQAIPIVAGLAQQGAATLINVDALWEDTLKAFGKSDFKRYFKSATPAPPPAQGGQAPPGAEQQALGITGPGSIDPSVSPSAMISQSPVTALQRAQALGGGGARNV